jgi:hypothetical protein
MEMRMKTTIVAGATVAAAAMALVLAGAAPAAAKQSRIRQHKPEAGKMACGAKNSCPAKVKDEKAAEPKAPGDGKSGEVK